MSLKGQKVKRMDGWVDGWMDGWMDGRSRAPLGQKVGGIGFVVSIIKFLPTITVIGI
jgi:hypothetical protein